MAKLFNRAKMTTSTTGSGTVTLGSASVGFQSFADAGVSDGDVVQYVIEEGGNFEIGTGTYSSSGTSLTRSPTESSNSDAAISLSGAATVSITAVADDLNRLQHEGSTKVEPSATGATVTGNLAVTGTVDGRDVAADGTKLDGIEASADVTDTANVTAAGALMDSEVTNLAQVKAFDSSDYATAAQGTTADAALPKSGGTMTGAITFASGQQFDGRDVSADGTKLDGIESGATADQTASEILTAIKTVDGSGSGLDADTLDGSHASAFLTGNQTITLSGDASGSGTTSIEVSLAADSVGASEIAANAVGASELNVTGNGTSSQFLRSDGDGTFTWATPTDTNTTYSAGSGLSLTGTTFSHTDTSSQSSVNNSGGTVIQDITLDTYGHVTGLTSYNLDGEFYQEGGTSYSGTYPLLARISARNAYSNTGITFTGSTNTLSVTGDITVGGTVDGRDVASDGTKLDGIESGATADMTASEILTAIKTVDGSGSGLDADTVDGYGTSTGSNANTIAVRQGSGYLFATYFNGSGTFSTTGGTSGMGLFTGTNGTDTYGRSYTAAAARALLNVEDGATADQTITAGTGLTGGGTGDVTISHADTSTLSGIYGSTDNGTKIDQITVDANGHITAISTGPTGIFNSFYIYDGDTTLVTMSNGNYLKFVEGGGIDVNFTDTSTGSSADPYDLTISHADTSSATSVNNSGNTVIQDITIDTYGHITGMTSTTIAASSASVPSGSVMLFAQTSAPTGWTKSTTHNNKALRVVSGTAGSGGTSSFTTAFASRTTSSTTAGGTVGSRTLTTAQMPLHGHPWRGVAQGSISNDAAGGAIMADYNSAYHENQSAYTGTPANSRSQAIGGEGGGGSHDHSFTGSSHSHTLDMSVQYVDVIIATKD